MRLIIRRTTAILVALSLLLVPISAQSVSSQGDVVVSTAVTSPAQHATAQQATKATLDLLGTGAWQKAACLGCVAGFLFATGTGSVAALILVMAAYPEAAALCAAGCYAAYAI